MGLFDHIASFLDDWHMSIATCPVADTPTISPVMGLPMTGGVDVAGNPCGTGLSSYGHDNWHHDPHCSVSSLNDHHSGWITHSRPAWAVGMTLGATDAVPWFDRLLARWEVSRFAVVPFGVTLFATPFTVASFLLTLSGDRRAMIVALMIVILGPCRSPSIRHEAGGFSAIPIPIPMPRPAGCTASVAWSAKRCPS